MLKKIAVDEKMELTEYIATEMNSVKIKLNARSNLQPFSNSDPIVRFQRRL